MSQGSVLDLWRELKDRVETQNEKWEFAEGEAALRKVTWAVAHQADYKRGTRNSKDNCKNLDNPLQK